MAAVASATPSRNPMVIMLAPKTEAINTGNRLCTSSEDISINMETRPSVHMPGGNARTVDRTGLKLSSVRTCGCMAMGSLLLDISIRIGCVPIGHNRASANSRRHPQLQIRSRTGIGPSHWPPGVNTISGAFSLMSSINSKKDSLALLALPIGPTSTPDSTPARLKYELSFLLQEPSE
jgi:hypothetical protein